MFQISNSAIGIEVVRDLNRKVELLHSVFPRRTIQPVLVYDGEITTELDKSPYIHTKISSRELL